MQHVQLLQAAPPPPAQGTRSLKEATFVCWRRCQQRQQRDTMDAGSLAVTVGLNEDKVVMCFWLCLIHLLIFPVFFFNPSSNCSPICNLLLISHSETQIAELYLQVNGCVKPPKRGLCLFSCRSLESRSLNPTVLLHGLYFFIVNNWNIVDLQCVNFKCTAKWFSYIYIYIYMYFRFFSCIGYYRNTE